MITSLRYIFSARNPAASREIRAGTLSYYNNALLTFSIKITPKLPQMDYESENNVFLSINYWLKFTEPISCFSVGAWSFLWSNTPGHRQLWPGVLLVGGEGDEKLQDSQKA